MTLPVSRLFGSISETIALFEVGIGSLIDHQKLSAASKRSQKTPLDATLRLSRAFVEETICSGYQLSADLRVNSSRRDYSLRFSMKPFDMPMELDEVKINVHDLAKKTNPTKTWICE
ncbi:predicted protein [Sclerotinia sclerotiorum 1980 UF-70]|uniref:Uncharacterized protein n=2 Tax=Sclerotinia sclerotiorum (strain ATCC 18683 / 1980 / Ss-1) TaxID=665079 RepID=A7F8I3_SCLS1|nr:predicted protein [Sclerotinia sclerotiorum 1980 UF-70]APA13819.1 hypothetical protein sscle_11g085890 [Sclerotinia sclerotiorum 1980 UF-70]EDN99054.1 predicted protein [Sclerotinia sclerotiorum 1980 UF-70]